MRDLQDLCRNRGEWLGIGWRSGGDELAVVGPSRSLTCPRPDDSCTNQVMVLPSRDSRRRGPTETHDHDFDGQHDFDSYGDCAEI